MSEGQLTFHWIPTVVVCGWWGVYLWCGLDEDEQDGQQHEGIQ